MLLDDGVEPIDCVRAVVVREAYKPEREPVVDATDEAEQVFSWASVSMGSISLRMGTSVLGTSSSGVVAGRRVEVGMGEVLARGGREGKNASAQALVLVRTRAPAMRWLEDSVGLWMRWNWRVVKRGMGGRRRGGEVPMWLEVRREAALGMGVLWAAGVVDLKK
jgi:hypothetical protein